MSNIIEITDFETPELDIYARLTETQLLHYKEPHNGLFIAESPKVIERALNAGYTPFSFLVERKHIQSQAKDILARCPDTPVYTADFDVLTQLTGFALTRGMLCAMHRKQLPHVEEICAHAHRIAILENVMNPTNIGAIFRSAAALGIDGVIVTSDSADPFYRRSSRVAMGTVFQVPWTYVDAKIWQHAGIDLLHQAGYQTAAMALRHNTVSIDDPKLTAVDRLAIIMGSEGPGLKEATIEQSDFTIKIPMAPGVDSLNVAAASALAFWELGNRVAE